MVKFKALGKANIIPKHDRRHPEVRRAALLDIARNDRMLAVGLLENLLEKKPRFRVMWSAGQWDELQRAREKAEEADKIETDLLAHFAKPETMERMYADYHARKWEESELEKDVKATIPPSKREQRTERRVLRGRIIEAKLAKLCS